MSHTKNYESHEITAEMIVARTNFHRKYSRGKDVRTSTPYDNFCSFSHAIRDLVIDRFVATQQTYADENVKRVYYLSMEFLIGRLLQSNMIALNIMEEGKKALEELGMNPVDIFELDVEPGLGNGGLGRLAACYLDSLASMEYPAYGYGLRYEHGIFSQEFEDGWQKEHPDDWLAGGFPWEIMRPEYTIPVCAYGRVEKVARPQGGYESVWKDWELFEGVPYDVPVIGYGVNTVNIMRLWRSQAAEGFRLDVFNQGDYFRAVEDKNWAENITKVLYPADHIYAGKELRLLQEYFLVTCSMHDIFRRYMQVHTNFDALPEKIAVQMNDTHPALAVAEMMNILCYEHKLDWDSAWALTTKSLNYTNHTLLPEALEKWPEELLKRVLPRHMEIIYEINHRFLQQVEINHPGDVKLIRETSIVEEGHGKQIRMANLAIIGSNKVNGVSALHSELIKEALVPQFNKLYPEKFINITNGITHRRWLMQCNPGLADLITETIGDSWKRDLTQLKLLEPFAEDQKFLQKFLDIKTANKAVLSKVILDRCGIVTHANSLYDVQIKRLHMYKRQLLKVMHIIDMYQQIKQNPEMEVVPRTFVFGAKAAPSYHIAKRVIKLITLLGDVINNDADIAGRIKVVFLPNYNVSLAEKIIPAADLSEQISTAGMEASGTGNMKLSLNGALTIGTWDGANIEIAQEVGLENIFIFGKRVEEVTRLGQIGYNPWEYYDNNPAIKRILHAIRDNVFCPNEPDMFKDIYDELTMHGDTYFYLADYQDYIDTQAKVDALFRDKMGWAKKAVLNVARMGWFSSDRCVHEYAEKIWGIKQIHIKSPEQVNS
jgi:starch phosphorylase